jgi:hypothetical protein
MPLLAFSSIARVLVVAAGIFRDENREAHQANDLDGCSMGSTPTDSRPEGDFGLV